MAIGESLQAELLASETSQQTLEQLDSADYFLVMRGPWKVPAWGMFYKTQYPTNKSDDFDANIKDLKISLNEPGRYDALKALAFAPKSESEERLEQVDVPTLVVMGTKDPDWCDPIAEAHFVQEKMSAELVLIEDAGHYPQTEMPEQTSPAIVEFLNRVQ